MTIKWIQCNCPLWGRRLLYAALAGVIGLGLGLAARSMPPPRGTGSARGGPDGALLCGGRFLWGRRPVGVSCKGPSNAIAGGLVR